MMHMTLRSYLFVPATRIDRILKAAVSGAGAVIVDLEDAVAPKDKVSSRQVLKQWLDSEKALPVYVRINASGTPWHAEDVELCDADNVVGMVVPKAEEEAQLHLLHQQLPSKVILPLIETAMGFHQALSVAKVNGVQRLLFGSIDFKKDLGISGEDEALRYFRSHLVLTSRLAGLQAPVDGVTTAIEDLSKVTEDAQRAAILGFGGKLCIHPKQIGPVENAFRPSASDIEWAQQVLKAAGEYEGTAVALNGQMIDKPVIELAQSMLARAVA